MRPEQAAVGCDHRGGNEVAVLEQAGDFRRGRVRRDALHPGIHHLADGALGVLGEQARERQQPQVAVVAIDDEEGVGLLGDVAPHAQVAQHGLERDVGAHADRVGVHEAAGGVVLEAEHGVQPFAVLRIHRTQHLLVHVLGQVAQEIGEVVDFEAFGGCDEFVRVHLADQARAHFLVELDEDVALELRIDEVPHHVALGLRQGFEQRRDFGRVHRINDAVHLPHGPLVEGALEHLEAGWACDFEFRVHCAE